MSDPNRTKAPITGQVTPFAASAAALALVVALAPATAQARASSASAEGGSKYLSVKEMSRRSTATLRAGKSLSFYKGVILFHTGHNTTGALQSDALSNNQTGAIDYPEGGAVQQDGIAEPFMRSRLRRPVPGGSDSMVLGNYAFGTLDQQTGKVNFNVLGGDNVQLVPNARPDEPVIQNVFFARGLDGQIDFTDPIVTPSSRITKGGPLEDPQGNPLPLAQPIQPKG